VQTLSVVVTTPPSSYLTITAIDFIKGAIEAGIDVVGIFFYQDGVLNASANLSIPNDEFQTANEWQKLHTIHNMSLHVCISACEMRGLTDEIDVDGNSPSGNNDQQSNINQYFTVSGLGELVELTSKSQRMVQF